VRAVTTKLSPAPWLYCNHRKIATHGGECLADHTARFAARKHRILDLHKVYKPMLEVVNPICTRFSHSVARFVSIAQHRQCDGYRSDAVATVLKDY
jgi:hypothetical protein